MTWWQNLILGVFMPGVVSFALSFIWAESHFRRGRNAQRIETLRLVRAEFLYWQDSADREGAGDTQQMIAMGAMGAVSNVQAAVMGSPAPWHHLHYVRTSEVTAASEVRP